MVACNTVTGPDGSSAAAGNPAALPGDDGDSSSSSSADAAAVTRQSRRRRVKQAAAANVSAAAAQQQQQQEKQQPVMPQLQPQQEWPPLLLTPQQPVWMQPQGPAAGGVPQSDAVPQLMHHSSNASDAATTTIATWPPVPGSANQPVCDVAASHLPLLPAEEAGMGGLDHLTQADVALLWDGDDDHEHAAQLLSGYLDTPDMAGADFRPELITDDEWSWGV